MLTVYQFVSFSLYHSANTCSYTHIHAHIHTFTRHTTHTVIHNCMCSCTSTQAQTCICTHIHTHTLSQYMHITEMHTPHYTSTHILYRTPLTCGHPHTTHIHTHTHTHTHTPYTLIETTNVTYTECISTTFCICTSNVLGRLDCTCHTSNGVHHQGSLIYALHDQAIITYLQFSAQWCDNQLQFRTLHNMSNCPQMHTTVASCHMLHHQIIHASSNDFILSQRIGNQGHS